MTRPSLLARTALAAVCTLSLVALACSSPPAAGTRDLIDPSDPVDPIDTLDLVDPLADIDDTTSGPRDTDDAPDLTPPEATDDLTSAPDDTDDAGDDLPGDATAPDDTATPDDALVECPPDTPCTVSGYVPPCYEGRCNARGTCALTRVAGCCLSDADCPPGLEARPCEASLCLSRVCTVLPLPGCCPDAAACDDGLASTVDLCLPDTARCSHCPSPCPASPPPGDPADPILERRFDTEAPLSALGFSILDQQPGDQVTWHRSTRRFAAGSGALHLANPRCQTYYGGALGADCAPTAEGQQDSQRVSVTLLSPFFTLPATTPAMVTFLVFSRVEPALGRGDAEPDVLRVRVEPLSNPSWPVASTLDLGKSTDWAPLAVDLAPWRGQVVRLRFEFDTFDGEDNLYEGVWLDELVVRATCTAGGCCQSDLDCAAPVSDCARARCLPFAQGSGRACAELPAIPGLGCRTCASSGDCDDADPCTLDSCELPASTSPDALGTCANARFCCLERELFASTFDTSLAPWSTPPPPTPTAPRWQVRAGRAWFGDAMTGTYASPAEAPARGTLTSPLIPLPQVASAEATPPQRLLLTFSLELSTEWDLVPAADFSNPTGLDQLTLELLDGALVTRLWTSDQLAGSTRSLTLPLTFDLTPWRGRTVTLRFTFDSGDGTANAFAGPFIDDLRLTLSCR